MLRTLIDIAQTGVTSLLLHPQRSLATVACVTAVLCPYLAGMGVSTGVQREAEISLQQGADLYVSGSAFGRHAALPVEAARSIESLEGVRSVTPRIVGSVYLGREAVPAVVVGLPAERLPESTLSIDGRLFAAGGAPELVLGSQLASRLGLRPDDRLPPFYRNPRGERVSRVVGVFRSGVSVWEANVMFTSIEFAGEIFDRPGEATELLVDCRPGYAESVRRQILRSVTFENAGDSLRPLVTTRDELQARLPTNLLHRDGVFNLHFLIAFAVGILVVTVTSGFGLSERRREVAILKALGWQTDELLFRSLVESLLLSLASASLSILLAYVWLDWLHGYWIGGVYLHGSGSDFNQVIPFALTPWPVLLSFIIAFVVVMSGSLYSTWRSAMTSPLQAMRR